MTDVLANDWTGCHREGWGSRLRPASFAHPAKVNYGLSVRIYEHALEEGWVKPGNYVVDCFSGVGGFALEAMRHGLHFVGVELEQRFVDMAQGCDCTGISKEDWVRYQGRWDRMRYEGGRYWCPECLMKASTVTNERKFKPLPLPGTRWGAIAIAIVKACQSTLFDAAPAAPSASYVRNSGKIPWTGAHRYHGNVETWERQGMQGSAVIVQGDSRRLDEVLARASLCLSSPPYGGNVKSDRTHERRDERRLGVDFTGRGRGCFRGSETYGDSESNLGNLPNTNFEAALAISSPVYIGTPLSDKQRTLSGQDEPDVTMAKRRGKVGAGNEEVHYGQSPGQLAQMPEGDLEAIVKYGVGQYGDRWPDVLAQVERLKQQAALPEGDHAEACERPTCCVSSPPFSQPGMQPISSRKELGGQGVRSDYRALGLKPEDNYGSTPGQLGQMPPGDHTEALGAGLPAQAGAEMVRAQCAISSPPWEASTVSEDFEFVSNRPNTSHQAVSATTGYGTTAGQLGQETGSTFWAASRQILEQVYQVLAPGGHCIWVLKMFVRSGRLVDFPGQWETLCQSVGFRTVCKHRAWLNKNSGIVQTTLDDDEVSMEKWYKSFFRILCENKGAPRIDFETVLCMVKPS